MSSNNGDEKKKGKKNWWGKEANREGGVSQKRHVKGG